MPRIFVVCVSAPEPLREQLLTQGTSTNVEGGGLEVAGSVVKGSGPAYQEQRSIGDISHKNAGPQIRTEAEVCWGLCSRNV